MHTHETGRVTDGKIETLQIQICFFLEWKYEEATKYLILYQNIVLEKLFKN